MKFDLTRPCGNCPFRSDRPFYLATGRVHEILNALIHEQRTFACHRTIDYSDGRPINRADTQHCAGAFILLERIGKPNQLTRIAERLGRYDRTKLAMDAPIYKTPGAMLIAFARRNRRA